MSFRFWKNKSFRRIGSSAPSSPAKGASTTSFSSQHSSQSAHAGTVAWNGLKTLLGVLESSVNAFAPLKSAIGGLVQCIDVFEKASQGHKEFFELARELDGLLGDLAHYDCVTDPAMTTGVKRLCRAMENEVSIVKAKLARNKIQGVVGAQEDQGVVYDCYRRIHSHVERLMLNASLNMWKVLGNDSMEWRLDRLLPKTLGAYDSSEADEVKRGACAPGTREPQLDKLKTWARSSSPNKICWLNGMAGTGKTTLTYSLCEELDATSELAASFFCTRLIPECRDVRLIVPTIAYQLARFSRRFHFFLLRALESDPDAHRRKLKVQFQKLIVDPLKAAQDALPSDFVVVIDALDECEDRESVGHILDLLVSDPSISCLPVRFLVSSRPEPEIYGRLEERVGHDAKLVLHDLDPDDVSRDIEIYLRGELRDLTLTDDQWTGLVRCCGVLFVYASTVCRYIKAGYEVKDHVRAMETVLGLSTSDQDEAMEDLNRLYATILSTAFDHQRYKSGKQKMRRILETVICAQEPLTLDALAGLLGLAKGSEEAEALLKPLGSVVRITERTRVVTTLHASFPDFLFSSERSAAHYCDARKQHGELAKTCLHRIRSNVPQFNVHGFESSYLLDSQVEGMVPSAERVAASGLLYACMYWATHLTLAGKLADALEPVYDFLSARLLLWMEVMNVGNRIGEGVAMMEHIGDWCQNVCMVDKDKYKHLSSYLAPGPPPRTACTCGDATELARDAWQFVSVYANHPTSLSTPHIYTSMLPVWPRTRPITRFYATRAAGLPQAEGQTITSTLPAQLANWSLGKAALSVCYHLDGSRIWVAAGNDIYVLHSTTGRTVFGPLTGHTKKILSITISSDGEMVASGSDDNSIRIWDARTGNLVKELLIEDALTIYSVAFSHDHTRVVAACDSGVLCIWNLRTGELIENFDTHRRYWVFMGLNSSAIFTADDTHIISNIYEQGIFRDENGRLISPDKSDGAKAPEFDPSESFHGHTSHITSLALSPDGTRVVSASYDSTIRVWDIRTKETVLGPLKMHSFGVRRALYSPNGRLIASCGEDRTICIWNAETGKLISQMEGHTAEVRSIAFSPDGSRLVSCSDDGTVRAWAMQHTGADSSCSKDQDNQITSARFSSNGLWLVAGTENDNIYLWDTRRGVLAAGPLPVRTGERIGTVASLDVSEDGSHIGLVYNIKDARLWNIKTWPPTSRLIPVPKTTHSRWIRFSSDNLKVLIEGSGEPEVYDIAEFPHWPIAPEPRTKAETHGDSILYCNDAPKLRDAELFGTLSRPLFTSREYHPLEEHSAIAPHQQHMVEIWRSTNNLSAGAFSLDGLYAITGSKNGCLHLWDTKTSQQIMGPFEGHTNRVRVVQFTSDNLRVMSFTDDGSVRFWTVPSKSELGAHNPEDTDQAKGHTLRRPSGWRLDDNGWVIDSQNHLLIWVPPDLRIYLLRPGNDRLISKRGSWTLKFDGANIGSLWTKCYCPAK